MNAIPLRSWTMGSSASSLLLPTCRHSLHKQLNANFFSTIDQNVLNSFTNFWQHGCTAAWARVGVKRAGDRSFASQASDFLSRRVLEFRQSAPVGTRVGWYKPSGKKPESLASRAKALVSRRRFQPDPRSSGPSDNLRRSFNRLPGEFVLWGILALNGAVYLAWQYAADQARAGNSALYVKMYKNILLSWRNIREGRIWTILTCTFSHSDAAHILLNGLSFFFMAPPIINLLGNSAFMGLYLAGGISCSVLSLLLNQSLRKREGSSHGASGAIYAVTSFFACVSPQTKFLIFFVVPVPAWAAVSGLFIWDGLSAISDRRTAIDGAGHVGGILAGVAYYFLKRRAIF
ncbi:rhomboid-domain-containing protein [Phellopilus nigrolimitatus]|nr:rhomboid-domain-containing protein [Phellopilus nigrolimitatus]